MTVAAKKIRQYMDQKKMTQMELAAELGVNRAQITRWLAGETSPPAPVQRRINARFGIRNEWVE